MENSEQPIPEITSPEIILKPEDLARSWLGHKGAELVREVRDAESSLDFDRSYEPKVNHSKRSSYGDSGMDSYDEEVSELETEDWLDNRERYIEEAEERVELLKEKQAENSREFSKVSKGESPMIDEYAKLETERRMEEAKYEKMLAEIRK